MASVQFRQYLAYYRDPDSRDPRPECQSVPAFYDAAAVAASLFRDTPSYMNHGYWDADTTSAQQASENLLSRLVREIRQRCRTDSPEPAHKVLDVACGLGGTAEYLSRYWPAASIHGINITEKQLEICRRTAPGCEFSMMDATSLAFADSSFDHVLCIEAAFQFRTRARFISEVHRVLKRGGVLALTDVLVIPESYVEPHLFSSHYPPENRLSGLEAYRELVREAGFESCDVIDITEAGSRSYFRFQSSSLMSQWRAGLLSFSGLQRHLQQLWLLECILDTQLLCVATK